jgi:serine protease Do
MGAVAALMLFANISAIHPSLAPRVPRMANAVVNVRATRRLVASVPFVSGLLPSKSVRAVGSGVIIAGDGLILTNEHIVHGASQLRVQLADHRELDAFVVGADPRLDVAVLRVDTRERLPAATLGRSGHVRVGDWVIAVGSPFGLDRTVTSGIVSARGRVLGVGPEVPLLQTDASINPGNSGGPLYDLDGRIIGLNTAIVAGAHGIGFAVPIDVVRRALPQLLRNGRIRRGAVGVRVTDVPLATARAQRMHRVRGALVDVVAPDGAFAHAGIMPGDVIVRWDGDRVDDSDALPWMVALTPPGTRVHVTVLREGDSLDREVRVESAAAAASAK